MAMEMDGAQGQNNCFRETQDHPCDVAAWFVENSFRDDQVALPTI